MHPIDVDEALCSIDHSEMFLSVEYCQSKQRIYLRSSGMPHDDDQLLYGKWTFGPLDDTSEICKEVIDLVSYFLRRERGY